MRKLLLLPISMILVSCGQATESQVSTQTKPSLISGQSPPATAAPAVSIYSNLPAIPTGWQWISGVRAKIAVPPNYVGGSPENLKSIAAQLPETGMDEATLVELLGRYVSPTNLFALDRTTLSKAFPTNLSLALDGKPTSKNLDSYLANGIQELADDWQVQKQEKMMLGNRQFARILAKSQKSPVTATIYITTNAQKFWLLTFTADNSEVDKNKLSFQKIAESLSIDR
jgi:hypothetical protein